ncbi:hypothetical protein GCM10022237_33520 [Nocardioides ginsengisoli]|uniref:MarR family transcriptional regulator n=1 Tax=Nocardioides ginsengisoli TaxID=363868 RepID=A0ABW3VW19_9ACTN
MKAHFSKDGVELELARHEYIFVYLALSHVIDGISMDDADFRNILGLERSEAAAMLDGLSQRELGARQSGQHWNPVPRGEQSRSSGE